MRVRRSEHLVAAILFGATASCANLGALLCQGDGCSDASADSSIAAGDGAAPGIGCGAAGTCGPPAQECCIEPGGAPACVGAQTCSGGSDVFCDDPRQCSGGPCWICINSQGFQGTSCKYQGDIVGNWHCDMTTTMQLCHLTSQCPSGETCKPLPVEGLDAGAGETWFSACQ